MMISLLTLSLLFAPQSVPQTPPPPILPAQVPDRSEVAEAFLRAQADTAAIGAVLDRMHRAASQADGSTYFDQFSLSARFIGTDAGERWSIGEFRAYAEPYFNRGQGWTYHPRPDRSITLYGDWATFDEVLDHDRYGVLRGSGVLNRSADGWKIEQYVLSFAVPNDRARQVVEVIQAPSTD
jgi:hypothetical protein